eukprot:CAMPEP_0178999690 /NCGR_PEP_ID=MMETSP0795-20121207/10218_1 /TAXON_ID=88552 /ORGANISM="Amoebophrya sp., Strain Ameob2" /LENGTH=138 /DNA_ID=CAMNT_0020692527 /DNA_START=46 /DNA_END=459 /DNA_ORIENTATION=-
MAEQQQQVQQAQEPATTQYEETAQGQYYSAFVTQDGYQVPAGVFHPPGTIQIPGQSFVGPPMGADGQPMFQLGGLGAPQVGFQTQPLQIGIPGGFHFAPEYDSAPAASSGYTPVDYTTSPVITRDAGFSTKKKARSAW